MTDDKRGPRPPQHVLNAVIVKAMLEHPQTAEFPDFPWADMTPMVVDWRPGPTDPDICPDDVWWVAVQYSSHGFLATYGVDRNNVPQCYMD